MPESNKFSRENPKEVFSKPDIFSEKGEFERVADTFNIDSSVLLWSAQQGSMTQLTEDIWSTLQNTDSYSVEKDDHDTAHQHAESVGRNYRVVAEAIYAGVANNEPIHAPIVMKIGNAYHLVSGNTRLMAARAYGVAPKVWLFEVEPTVEVPNLLVIDGGEN
jgi:hypothetical protein